MRQVSLCCQKRTLVFAPNFTRLFLDLKGGPGHRDPFGDIKVSVTQMPAKKLFSRTYFMNRLFAIAALYGMTIATQGAALAQSVQGAEPAESEITGQQPVLKGTSPSGNLPALPPPPRGKSTIMGGEIRTIDPVRDELTLNILGGRPVKILFDERTQVYRDGKKIPLRDLSPVAHASVQTLLDGTDVYALSIHMLSQSPEGDYQGRVLGYNPGTSELTLSSASSHEPIKLLVTSGTHVSRVGQAGFTGTNAGAADLVRGALISVKFQPDIQGRGVARDISVLAIPGSAFVFIGNISSLDTHLGVLSLVDPHDEKEYQISFDSGRLPVSQTLHPGDHIIVTANFDGTRYVASAITVSN
jgi:hypothetical protein